MGCGWVVAFTLVVSAIPATARNAEASFWVTTFDHTNGGEGGCDYRPGTTGTTSKGRCGECIAYPTSVRSLLGDAYRFNCVGAVVQSFEYNCTAALGCSDCTVVEDEIPKCTDVTRTGGGQTFGVSIKGVSVEDGVCRAHPYPLVDAKFLTVYPTSDCTVDGEDYATVRLFNVSKEGCSPSGYSQLFYDLSVDTDNAVPMFSGGVDCTEATCGTCAVAFSKIEEGICTEVTVDGASKSMKLLDCTLPPKPQQEDEGPVYTAELLAVGVLVMVVGAFFILQSCQRIGSNRMQTMSLNAPEEEQALLSDPSGYNRDPSGRVSYKTEPERVVPMAVGADQIAAAVAAEKAEQLARQQATADARNPESPSRGTTPLKPMRL